MMTTDNLAQQLAAHRLLGAAPAREIEWLAERGKCQHFDAGDVVASPGEPLEALWAVLAGHVSIRVVRGGGPRRAMEWLAGDLSGVLPYSRMKAPPGVAVAVEPTELFLLGRDHFPALIRECHEVTSICVHVMLDRARHFTTTDFQDEKMLSLGRLAAGLAHELNNPASAVARGASALPESLTAIDRAARQLGAAALSAEQLAAIDQLRAFTASHSAPSYRPALERANDEEALANWLSDRRIDEEPAEVLADVPEALAALERVESLLDAPRLEAVVEYIAAEYAARKVVGEIERAAARISDLIATVKRFSYMDQAGVPKPVDIVAGLQDTIVMFGAKARSKSVTVTLDAASGLPLVTGFGGELNQVWANLIDNAIDAADKNGHIAITVGCQRGSVMVSIVDDGPGIAPEHQARVFDPFFTTKPVGQGTGLGLDIARRIVHRHEGDIALTSIPGRTEFVVTLPPRGGSDAAPAAGSRA